MRVRSRFRDSFVATRGKPPFFLWRFFLLLLLLLRPSLVAERLLSFVFFQSLTAQTFFLLLSCSSNALFFIRAAQPSFPAHIIISLFVKAREREKEKERNSLSENAEDGECEHEQRFLGLVLTPTQEQLSIQHVSGRIDATTDEEELQKERGSETTSPVLPADIQTIARSLHQHLPNNGASSSSATTIYNNNNNNTTSSNNEKKNGEEKEIEREEKLLLEGIRFSRVGLGAVKQGKRRKESNAELAKRSAESV